MSSRATIADLALKSGVSTATIDRILSGRSKVKRATIETVLQAAEELGFHGAATIRARLQASLPERRFGILLNGRERRIYQGLAECATTAAASLREVRGRVTIRHVEAPEPAEIIAALEDLQASCEVIACSVIDHPRVNACLAEIAAAGMPVLSLISDISAPGRVGFVGTDDWKIGRTAGWFMELLARPSGKIAVLNGSSLYQCQ